MNFDGSRNKQKRLLRLLQILTISFIVSCGVSPLAISVTYSNLPDIGNWLVSVDPVRKADAIAVLSGCLPVRALEAAKLYRRGFAKEIWLTHPGAPQNPSSSAGIHFPSEDVLSAAVLRHHGVPARAIHVLETPIVNTADELNAIGAALKRLARKP